MTSGDQEILDEMGLGHLSLVEARALIKIAIERKKAGKRPAKNISIVPKMGQAECIKCQVEIWVDFIWLDGRPPDWKRQVEYHVKKEIGSCKQTVVRKITIEE